MDSSFSKFKKSARFLNVLHQGYVALDNPEDLSLENIVRFVVGNVGLSERSGEIMNDLLECIIDDCIALGYSASCILDFKMLRHQYLASRPRSCKRFCHFLMKVAQTDIDDCLLDENLNIIFSDNDLLRDAFYGGNWKFFSVAIMHGISLDLSNEIAHYESCREVSKQLSDIGLPISFLVSEGQKNLGSLGFSKKRTKLVGVCYRLFSEIMLNKKFKNEYIKCLPLLYEYIEEPKVSCEEIKLFCRALCHGKIDEACLNRFGKKCMEYIPECALPYSPRSLKHLARCKVRKCLKEAGRDAQEIPPTRISEKLVPYLKLKIIQI